MTVRQPQLHMMPEKTRKKPVKRAHVSDAGEGIRGFPYGAKFTCSRCNWISEWICFDNITEIRRGVPCVECNKPDT